MTSEDAANYSHEKLESTRALVSQATPVCETSIRSCYFLRDDDKDQWCDDFRDISVSKSVANVLLLTLLPNIQHLTIAAWSYDGTEDHIWIAVKRIAKLSYRRRSSKTCSSGEALPRLRRLTLNFSGDDYDNVEAFMLFALLPSIRCLEGNGMMASGPRRLSHELVRPSTTWPKYFKMGSSTVTKLSLTNSSVHPATLDCLLAGTESLANFSYHHCRGRHLECYKPGKIVKMLQIHAAGTLVRLDLTAVDPKAETLPSGSLQMFTALNIIRADDIVFKTPARYVISGIELTSWRFY